VEEVGGPVSDGSESLDNKGLACNSLAETNLLEEGWHVKHLTDSIVDTKASGFGSSHDSTLLDELTSAAAFGVDVLLTLDLHVGVLNPGHDLLVGSHVRSEAIDRGSDESLLNELHGVLAGNSFEFSSGKISGVDLDTSLGTAERNIGDSELEGHEAGEGFDFLEINVVRVTGASLDWELMSRVLGSVASDCFKTSVVSAKRDVESDDGVASLYHLEVLWVESSLFSSRGEEQFDLLEETWLSVLIRLWAKSWLSESALCWSDHCRGGSHRAWDY